MNKREILLNAIILPLSIGIILSAIFCLYLNANIDRALPVPQGTAFAYHDEQAKPQNEVDAKNLCPNDTVGSLSIGDISLGVVYETDYSNLVGAVSMQKCSTALDEIGCAYFKTNFTNAKIICESDKINIDSVYGSFEYELVGKMSFDSEYQATTYAPSIPRGIVIYYQNSDGAGLTSNYKALIYKEVK